MRRAEEGDTELLVSSMLPFLSMLPAMRVSSEREVNCRWLAGCPQNHCETPAVNESRGVGLVLLGELLPQMVRGRDASLRLIMRESGGGDDDDDVSYTRRRKQGAQ